MAVSQPDFTVVITCFNEELSIGEFSSRLFMTLADIDATFEVVFVDDGSRDGTLACLLEAFRTEPLVSAVVSLMSNAGQAAAITAGIGAARGRNFVFMDSDLQLDPEDLPRLIAEFRAGNDVVSGYRVGRKDAFRRRVYSKVANTILRKALGVPFRDFGCTFKVIDGRLVRAFNLGPRNLLRLIDITAASRRCSEIPVKHHERRFGHSGWTLFRLIDLQTDNVVVMMKRPFQYVAAAAAIAGALLLLRVALDAFYPIRVLDDVTNGLLLNAIIVSLLIVATIQALTGELVIRSHESLRSVPAYIIRELITRTGTDVLAGSSDPPAKAEC